jgi:hypothetical protein
VERFWIAETAGGLEHLVRRLPSPAEASQRNAPLSCFSGAAQLMGFREWLTPRGGPRRSAVVGLSLHGGHKFPRAHCSQKDARPRCLQAPEPRDVIERACRRSKQLGRRSVPATAARLTRNGGVSNPPVLPGVLSRGRPRGLLTPRVCDRAHCQIGGEIHASKYERSIVVSINLSASNSSTVIRCRHQS